MSHHVSIWRAAQLVGVSRGVLQQQVRDGTLATCDGLVAIDELLRCYPTVQLEESGMLERVVQIRDEAFGKRVRERILPSQEVLAQRVFLQSQELANVRRHLQRYHALVIELQQSVRAVATGQPEDAKWQALDKQIKRGLAKALATESVGLLEVMDDMLKIMTAQVTVRPSGHQFAVEGHANLLQSGLHAGLKLNYGCGNGSCGMCKVRVISGDLAPTQHSDYPLSEAEKAQGYALMCCHTAASSELTLELLEASGPQDMPLQQIGAQVRAVSEPAPNTRLVHLQTPRTHRLRFLAGQSVSLGWARAGFDDVRSSYPVASCPCDDRNLLFFVHRDQQDGFARQVFAGNLAYGSQVTVYGPTGEFVLREGGHRPQVFAACDGGFAPVKSLIEHSLSLDAAPALALFWLATQSDGHFYANQCRAWSEALDQFEYELITHADAEAGAAEVAHAMRVDLFDVSDCDFYLAGPARFVQTLAAELNAGGVPAAQISVQLMEAA